MIKRLSLNHKLFLYFIFLGLIIIAVVSGLMYNQAKSAILQRTFEQLTSVRAAKQRQLERFFLERRQDIGLLAHSQTTDDLTRRLHRDSSGKPRNTVNEPFLFRFLNQYPYSAGILIKPGPGPWYEIKSDSSCLHSKIFDVPPEILRTATARFSEEKVFVFQDYMKTTDTSQPSLWLGRLRMRNGSDSVFLVLTIPVMAINQVMLDNEDYKGLGQTGESYAVGPDYTLRSSSRFYGSSVYGQRVESKTIDSALAGKEGTDIITDYRGVRVLCSFGRISVGESHWAILAEIDWTEAMAPVEEFKRHLSYLSLMLAAALFITSFIMARRVTRPISRLLHAVNIMRRGDFADPVDVLARDELGELTDGFNKMAQQLKEREQRLRHFYDATPDGIVFHHGRRIVLVNHAITRMSGFTAAALTGRSIDDIILPDDRPALSESGFFETRAIRDDGSTFPVEIQEHPIEYDGTQMLVTVIRDITLRKKVEQDLRLARVRRISSVIDGQEQERQRVARELHDGLGQYLVAIKLRIENALDSPPEKINPILAETRSLCDTTIDEVRRISNGLMPAVLYELGFLTALHNLCAELSQPDSLMIRPRITVREVHFDERIQVYLFRIAQEALTNVVKHAGAGEAELLFHEDELFVLLQISDNGGGFDTNRVHTSQSRGLQNIRTRVNLLNGVLNIESSQISGTTIFVQVPKQTAEKNEY